MTKKETPFWSAGKIWHKNSGVYQKDYSRQGDDYTTGCLLDCPYFKENYKLIVTDLIKQQTHDADPKGI